MSENKLSEAIREVKQYNVVDDAMPLHQDFYKFIQKDEKGYFIQHKDGFRFDITLRTEVWT